MRQAVKELSLPKLDLVSWLRYLNNRRRTVNPTSRDKRAVELPDNLEALEAQVIELTNK